MGTVVFNKTYTGSIKRKISEGRIASSVLPELYVETEQKVETEFIGAQAFSSKIFNIVEKNSHVEITTNTLALNITDIFEEGVPYFRKLVGMPKELPQGFTLIGNEYFTNQDIDYIQEGTSLFLVQPVFKLNTYQASPNIVVRRLKDRFKITLKHRKLADLHIELNSEFLLQPRTVNNYNIFPEVVFNYDGGYKYLISHTFEEYVKHELHNKSESIVLRDIPLDNISMTNYSSQYYLISYKTFRSALFVPVTRDSAVYVNIRPFTDKLLNIETTLKQMPESFLRFQPSKVTTKTFTTNPYTYTPYLTLNPKGYYFVWERSKKYSMGVNVPLGCETVQLDRTKILARATKSVELKGVSYEDYVSKPVKPFKVYKDMPKEIEEGIQTFLNLFKEIV